MKERGILFSGPMVRALLDGRKTQTRRIIKHTCRRVSLVGPFDRGRAECASCHAHIRGYGPVGDWLWVRETFAWELEEDGGAAIHPERFLYRADGDTGEGKWVPSIHMPRRASRITLKISGIKVEPVRAISDRDAAAEGFFDAAEFLATFFGLNKRAPADSNPWVWAIAFRRIA